MDTLHIFDFDNTIYPSNQELVNGTSTVLSDYNLSIDTETIHRSIGASTLDRFLGYGLLAEDAHEASGLFYKALEQTCFVSQIDEDIRAFIDDLNGTLVIVTNSPKKYVENFLVDNDLTSRFLAVYSAIDLGKPKKQIFKELRNVYQNDHIIAYGDSWEDCTASRYILAKFIAVKVWCKDQELELFSDGVIYDFQTGIEKVSFTTKDFVSLQQQYFGKLLDLLNHELLDQVATLLMNRDSTLLLFGNGGISDEISHFMTDYKRFCYKHDCQVNAFQLAGSKSYMSAVSNDSDYYDLIHMEAALFPAQSQLVYMTTSDCNPRFDSRGSLNNPLVINPFSLTGNAHIIPEIFESLLSFFLHLLIIRLNNSQKP